MDENNLARRTCNSSYFGFILIPTYQGSQIPIKWPGSGWSAPALYSHAKAESSIMQGTLLRLEPGPFIEQSIFFIPPTVWIASQYFTYNNSARPGVSGTGIPRQENIEAILLQLPHGFHLMRFTGLIIRPGSGWTASTFCTSVPTAWRIGRN
jgi:hypothetical protein